MKILVFLPLLILIMGCAATVPHKAASLSPERAKLLALRLANDKAQALYECQPFQDGPTPQLVDNRWVWTERRGRGKADLEAHVSFDLDGSAPNADVLLLSLEVLF
ncbi:MAG: hypothetical protein HY298_18990 [Verrucomicrobia bacterium]|nr:hypothetical protein [Verrucomicrobiota bacterium]